MSDEKSVKSKNLTLKQQKFVDAYIDSNGNATEAALVAYECDNKVDASNIGYQNMQKPHIQEIIQAKLKDLKDNTLDTFKNNNLINTALATAQDDLMDDDPKVRDLARRYILEVAKYLSDSERSTDGTKHNHLHITPPKWKG